MHRPLDDLTNFETASQTGPATPARYAVRQALDQEYQKYLIKRDAAARLGRYQAGGKAGDGAAPAKDNKEGVRAVAERTIATKLDVPTRDFFGRIIDNAHLRSRHGLEASEDVESQNANTNGEHGKVWVSFHEGFSNAVRKPITLEEMMRGF